MGTQPYNLQPYLCSLLESLQKKKKKGAPLDDDFLGELGLRPCFFFNFD
jgi:hypothetical protein